MHFLQSRDIYLSRTYPPSVYEITYKTLGHTHPGIDTASYKGEDIPYKKDMESD